MPRGKVVLPVAIDSAEGTWRNLGWTGEPAGPPDRRAGRLCLDFVNTVGFRSTDHPLEFLTSYPVLLAWGLYTGTLDDDEATRLQELAALRPDRAAAVHRQALAFRDTVYRLFVAIAHGEDPAPADVDEVTRLYRVALDHARLVPQSDHFAWEWSDGVDELDRPLWPIAWSAVELLTTEDRTRIKVCPGGDGSSCFWLFFDATKNRIRRWCSMENCGNSAKTRRQTARRRSSRGSPDEPQGSESQ